MQKHQRNRADSATALDVQTVTVTDLELHGGVSRERRIKLAQARTPAW